MPRGVPRTIDERIDILRKKKAKKEQEIANLKEKIRLLEKRQARNRGIPDSFK
jgi:flagellar motility protein MotE (MotC chaperone)